MKEGDVDEGGRRGQPQVQLSAGVAPGGEGARPGGTPGPGGTGVDASHRELVLRVTGFPAHFSL